MARLRSTRWGTAVLAVVVFSAIAVDIAAGSDRLTVAGLAVGAAVVGTAMGFVLWRRWGEALNRRTAGTIVILLLFLVAALAAALTPSGRTADVLASVAAGAVVGYAVASHRPVPNRGNDATL